VVVVVVLGVHSRGAISHLLRGGPTPDSVDDTWEGLDTDEANQLIEDSIWYKEFHTTNDTSRVLPLLRRLAAVQFWASSPSSVRLPSLSRGTLTDRAPNG
jgi:hypothetical protein